MSKGETIGGSISLGMRTARIERLPLAPGNRSAMAPLDSCVRRNDGGGHVQRGNHWWINQSRHENRPY